MKKGGKKRDRERTFLFCSIVFATERKILEGLVSMDVRLELCVKKLRPTWYIKE